MHIRNGTSTEQVVFTLRVVKVVQETSDWYLILPNVVAKAHQKPAFLTVPDLE